MSFGTYLRQQRERHNLSLRAMSRITGIPHATLWKLECDRTDPMLRTHLVPIAKFHGESVVGFLRTYNTQRKGRKTDVR